MIEPDPGRTRTVSWTLAPGSYRIRLYSDTHEYTQPVRIEHPGTITITLDPHEFADIRPETIDPKDSQ